MATRKSKKTTQQALHEPGAKTSLAEAQSDATLVVANLGAGLGLPEDSLLTEVAGLAPAEPKGDHTEAPEVVAREAALAASAAVPPASVYSPEPVDTVYQAAISTGNEKGRFIDYPDSPFHLYQPYPPGGDQPRAIDLLEQGVRDGLMSQTLLGVTGSGKTFTMANMIARLGRPALVLAPNKTLAAQLYAEMREFFPKNAVEYFVSYYDYYQPEAYVPTRDLFIEKDSSINEHIEQMRLSATKSLLERRDTIIVGTVSCIYGIGNPADYHAMVLILRAGDRIARRDACR